MFIPNILIVDDKESNIVVLEELFKDGFDTPIRVIRAFNGEDALRIALEDKIDLIILDVQMPGMDGFEVAKYLKSGNKTRHIPVIFLTAVFKSEEFSAKGFDIGAIDYMTKPIDEHQFLNRIKLYLQIFDKQHELERHRDHLEELVAEKTRELRDKDELMMVQSRHAAMGEMISMIAHQWRQPITSISMGANNMIVDIELGSIEPDNLRKLATEIIEQTQYLSKTIDDFRNFFKPNKTCDEVTVCDVIDETIQIIGKSLENNNVTVNWENTCRVKISTYSRELMQVFLNILKNAKEAMIERGIENPTITIDIIEEAGSIVTTISDNGGGIDESIINRIFEPYFTTKGDLTGTGLGLYMSDAIVTKHLKGTIEASNTEEGACFKISLPV